MRTSSNNGFLFDRKGTSIIERFPQSGRELRQPLAANYVFRWPGIMTLLARYGDGLHKTPKKSSPLPNQNDSRQSEAVA